MIEGYLIEPEDFNKLKNINKRLYQADDKPFKQGEVRDLANLMDFILYGVQELREV